MYTPTLLDPSEARDNMNKGIYDDNKDADSERVCKVKPVIKIHCEKFDYETFLGVAL